MNLEEIENNLNYVEDMAHNIFKFRIRMGEKSVSYAEAMLIFRKCRKNNELVQACEIAEVFFKSYERALTLSEPYVSLRKAHFNTLRAEIKNAVSDNTKK